MHLVGLEWVPFSDGNALQAKSHLSKQNPDDQAENGIRD